MKIAKKTKKQIVEKFYNSEYQKNSKIEELARRFEKTPDEIDGRAASVKNCHDLFVEAPSALKYYFKRHAAC